MLQDHPGAFDVTTTNHDMKCLTIEEDITNQHVCQEDWRSAIIEEMEALTDNGT